MSRGEHFYTCLDCGQRKTCGDCVPVYCPACAKKPKACRLCGRVELQGTFGFTSVCSVCWRAGNDAIDAEAAAEKHTTVFVSMLTDAQLEDDNAAR